MKVYPVNNKCIYSNFEDKETLRIARKIKDMFNEGFNDNEIIDLLIGEDNEDLDKVKKVMETFFSDRPIRRRRRDLSCLNEDEATAKNQKCINDIAGNIMPKCYRDIKDKIKNVLLSSDISDILNKFTANNDDDIAIIPRGRKELDDLSHIIQKLQLDQDDFITEHEMDFILQDIIDNVINNMRKIADHFPFDVIDKNDNYVVLNDGINEYIVEISKSGIDCRCPFNLYGYYRDFGIPCCHVIWVIKNLLEQEQDTVQDDKGIPINYRIRAEGKFVPCDKYEEEVDVDKVCRFCRHCRKIDDNEEAVYCVFDPHL